MKFLIWGRGVPLTEQLYRTLIRGKAAAPPEDSGIRGDDTFWCFEVALTQPEVEELRASDHSILGYAEVSAPEHLAEVIPFPTRKR